MTRCVVCEYFWLSINIPMGELDERKTLSGEPTRGLEENRKLMERKGADLL